MNSAPPAYATTFSLKYSPIKSPVKTANPVATQCPAVPPKNTCVGSCAAANAMVAKKLLSPHSAAKTNANVLKINAWSPLNCIFPISTFASSFSSSATSSASSAPLIVLIPKYNNKSTAKISSNGIADSLNPNDPPATWKNCPMHTDNAVITANAPNVPKKTLDFFSFKASKSEMKNVLSPSSERRIKRNACAKPPVDCSSSAAVATTSANAKSGYITHALTATATAKARVDASTRKELSLLFICCCCFCRRRISSSSSSLPPLFVVLLLLVAVVLFSFVFFLLSLAGTLFDPHAATATATAR
mmetsp:Transcript_1401/g.4214  ORF Transcript_1401/g.4214 Transcript_1401/m.4214 type:complete len:303 (+) Transcript_1401:953-1861(+)